MVKQPAQIFAIHCYNLIFGMKHLDARTRFLLVKGKIRRLFYTTFHKDYVEHCLNLRKSGCGRSGICCRLGYTCPNLGHTDNNLPYCKIHEHRPQNCRIFPLDWEDIRDRDLIANGEPCGYSIPSREENSFHKFRKIKKQLKLQKGLGNKQNSPASM
ncbi:MAG: hypothetical protein AABZ60_09970 [Planctomycetota bacterium]